MNNLVIERERTYHVRIVWQDGRETLLRVNSRVSWQRLSAITHARSFARRNPTCVVHVETLDGDATKR